MEFSLFLFIHLFILQTCLNAVCRENPPSLKYRRRFLRELIKRVGSVFSHSQTILNIKRCVACSIYFHVDIKMYLFFMIITF